MTGIRINDRDPHLAHREAIICVYRQGMEKNFQIFFWKNVSYFLENFFQKIAL